LNKRTRLVVSLLFIVLIALSVAITQFYVNVPENQQKNSEQNEIANIISTNNSGISIFSDSSGSLGLSESGRVTAAAEWTELTFAGDSFCIAAKKIRGDMLYGCIDYEGNVVVPLIYSEISRTVSDKYTLYTAVSASDGKYVIYNENFTPVFRNVWDNCEVSDGDFIFNDTHGRYVYSVYSDGLLFKRADVSGNILGKNYELSIISRVLLSKLTPAMIEKMLSSAEKYINYAMTGNEENIQDMTENNIRDFKKLFPDSEQIISKQLKSVPEIHIYSIKSRNDMPCYEVAVTAEIDIGYTDRAGTNHTSNGIYRSAVQFCGSSESTLKALSGKFDNGEKFIIPEDETYYGDGQGFLW
ncbi:MAG: hypothetical protein K2J37_03965, partial [Ruminococcus sp.]|nr:hypothetical protein [Ruminococcus sp.]